MSKEEWLNRYIYTYEHETFFCFFLCELNQWLSKLVDSQGTWKLDNPIVWTLELVRHLDNSGNKITRVVDYWINTILDGFITKFVLDKFVSYSKAEC